MMDENDRSQGRYRSLRHISRKEGSEDTAPIEVRQLGVFFRASAGTAQHTASGQASPEAAAAANTPYRPRPSRPWMEPWQYLPSGGKFC